FRSLSPPNWKTGKALSTWKWASISVPITMCSDWRKRVRILKMPKKNERKSISKSIIFSLVFLVLGFIMAYSYSLSNQREAESDFTGASFFEQKEQYRKELIEQQERNKELRDELGDKQKAVQEFERSVVDGEEN